MWECKMVGQDFPVVEGDQRLTDTWSFTLPGRFSQRVEDGSLVFWRPGFTVWIDVWHNNNARTPKEQCEEVRKATSSEAFDPRLVDQGAVVRYAYRLRESSEQGKVAGLYAFAFDVAGQVNAAFYFDAEDDLAVAEQIWLSIQPPGSIQH
jgi:hypothetical protein